MNPVMDVWEPFSETPFPFPKSEEIYRIKQTYLSKLIRGDVDIVDGLRAMASDLEFAYTSLDLQSQVDSQKGTSLLINLTSREYQ